MSHVIQRPCALLRLMAGRQGQKITALDVAALHLAVRTMEAQDDKLMQSFQAWGTEASEAIRARACAAALQDGMRALLEAHS